METQEKKNKSDDNISEFSSTTKIAPVIGHYHEKDELYNPFDHREKKNTNSDFDALAHLVKSSLGSGILAMPYAVKNGGLLFGGIGTIIIGILCTHCVHILVRSSHVLCKKTKTPQMGYAETAYTAFSTGPKFLRRCATFAKILVNAALCATYIGGTCVYVIFVATSVKQVTDYYTDSQIPIRLYMAALIPAVLLLGQIRNLKILVPISMIANVLLITGLMITLYFVFVDLPPLDSVPLLAPWSNMPKFFTTVIFAIEGIGVILPLENSMKNPHHFLGCPSVLNISMTIVIGLYTIMGIFGYMRFGDDVKGSITLNLLDDNVLAQVVKLLIALAVLFTYGLQFFVPFQIMWNAVKNKFGHKYEVFAETVLRIILVLFTVGLACLVPNLEPFIGLVGAIFLSFLGIFIPASIETVSCWEANLGTLKWRLWKNLGLIIFSIFALVFGTLVSIEDIIQLYKTRI